MENECKHASLKVIECRVPTKLVAKCNNCGAMVRYGLTVVKGGKV